MKDRKPMGITLPPLSLLTRLIPKSLKSSPYLHLLVIAGAIFGVYYNALHGAFQFDDYPTIVNSGVVHTFGSWLDDALRGIRPLLKLSYLISWYTGPGVLSFHLFNMAVHGINSLFVYVLTLKIVNHTGSITKGKTIQCTVALATALIFALHPIQTEGVTYLSGRSTSLMALFYLAALLAYIQGGESGKKVVTLIISPLLFLCALAVKEPAVTLPVALLLWELTGHQRLKFSTIIARQGVHWSILALVFMGLLLHPGYRTLILSYHLAANMLTPLSGLGYLLSHLVLPGRLNIDPDLPVVSTMTPVLAVTMVLFFSALAVAVALVRKKPWVTFFIIWFFLLLLPTNSFILRPDVANDRQMYLPLFGVALGITIPMGRLTGSLGRRGRRALLCITVLLLVTLAGFTMDRNWVYRTEISLWEDTAGKSPSKARVYNNLGCAYLNAHRNKEAKDAFLTALRLNPHYDPARFNLAVLAKRAEAMPPIPMGSPSPLPER
jgi:protein O-mannosyl-transferase